MLIPKKSPLADRAYHAITDMAALAPIYETQLDPVHVLKDFARFDVMQGECDIAPGVRCVLLPGHTPGLEGVLMDTTGGRTMLANDHCPLYENFERPTGMIHDLEAWYTSTARIRSLAESILPTHDMRVLEPESES